MLPPASQDLAVRKERKQANEPARRKRRDAAKERRGQAKKLGKPSESILVVNDGRAMGTPGKAFLNRKDPDSSGGEALWKSRRNRADICCKELK